MKLDPITQKEIDIFRERKIDEHMKIGGQIARDLRRLGGDYAFLEPAFYAKLREKYRRAHAGKKKLAILEMMKNEWCRAEDFQ